MKKTGYKNSQLRRFITFMIPFRMVSFLAVLSICACGDDPAVDGESVTGEPVTFAVYGNSGMAFDDGEMLSQLAGHLTGSSPDFAVDLGNRLPPGISSSAIGTFLPALDNDRELFSCPVFAIPGKNDIFDYDSDVAFSERYGPQWYSFTRGGTAFIVLSTEDGAYMQGFGVRPAMSEEQLLWLADCLDSCIARYKVVFMHRQVWLENPLLWRTELRPLFEGAGIDLIIACSPEGLMDHGRIDGFRVVTTGCTGPVDGAAPGLFPHILLVTAGDGDPRFGVLGSDGRIAEGIEIDNNFMDKTTDIVSSLSIDQLSTDNGWNVSQSLNIDILNSFSEPVSGAIDFKSYQGTAWKIEPPGISFVVDPGMKSSYRIGVKASSPELGPVPLVHGTFAVGGRSVYDFEDEVRVDIPPQRTGAPVPVDAHIADIIPYGFNGVLAIPVEIPTYDLCGRCIIYRVNGTGDGECVHIAPLMDFKPGINEFRWNGRDLSGRQVRPDSLTYRIFVYNKRAPATWVADGPPNRDGTFLVENTLKGLTALTHDRHSLKSYKIGGSLDSPQADLGESFDGILESLPMNGFSYGDGNRMYIGTNEGFAAVQMSNGRAVPDRSFGSGGYVAYSGRRGRSAGPPSSADGYVAVGFGGNDGTAPELVIFDADTGEETTVMDLGVFFGDQRKAPAIRATGSGIFCAHPDNGTMVKLSREGSVIWTSDPESYALNTDSDGQSYIYGIGVDSNGFAYVNTPGYSARCAVIGPDGLSLFRVILVSLPGLRVSSVTPSINGESSDGLYFTTSGGDRPYVFHIPFTVRTGLIVDESAFLD